MNVGDGGLEKSKGRALGFWFRFQRGLWNRLRNDDGLRRGFDAEEPLAGAEAHANPHKVRCPLPCLTFPTATTTPAS